MTTEPDPTPPVGGEPLRAPEMSLDEAAEKLAEADAQAEDQGAVTPLANEPEGPETQSVHAVTFDGEEQGVSLDELKAGYQRQADYTRKTQSLADERRAVQAERAQYQQLLQSFTQGIAEAPAQPPDQATFDRDPAEYIRQAQAWQVRAQMVETAQREQGRLQAAFAQEQDGLLAQAVPEWTEQGAREKGTAEVRDYVAKTYGATDDELNVFTDHRMMMLAHKAMQFDALMANKDLAHKKVRGVPQVQAPGAARSQQEVDADTVTALRNQFHKTGSIDDAAKLMHYLGG